MNNNNDIDKTYLGATINIEFFNVRSMFLVKEEIHYKNFILKPSKSGFKISKDNYDLKKQIFHLSSFFFSY